MSQHEDLKLLLGGMWSDLKRRLPLVVLVSVVLALIVYGALVRLGPQHVVHFSYIVSLSEREQTRDFSYDGFYALQATDLFTATLARWSTTPEVVAEAFTAAQLDVPEDGERGLRRAVRADKTAPQLIQLTVRLDDRDRALRLTAALRDVLSRNIMQYHDQGVPQLTFRAVATEVWVSTEKPAALPIAAATFVATLILLGNAVLLVSSLKRQ